MGLIKAAFGSAGGVLADQWKEYFSCDSLPADIIAVKGRKRTSGRSSNRRGSDNVITDGSVVAVADGQCMLIVEQGKVVDVCAEPGEYVYSNATEPSVFTGDLDGVREVFDHIGKRFAFGGQPPEDQRVYYFNTKELVGNKYGTPNPVPFRVVDRNAGLDADISIRCFGEYSYRVVNPILFYTNVCGNVEDAYSRGEIDGQLKTELLTALQPAFARISAMGIRYSALPGHTQELADVLNQILTAKWRGLRGIEIVSFGVSSVTASGEDEAMIKQMQRDAAYRDTTTAAAALVGAQAQAMRDAARNASAGPAMAFMGMNMAGGAGGAKARDLYQMGRKEPAAQTAASWTCSCGAVNTGKFCTECGRPRPGSPAEKPKAAPAASSWTCSCGAVNTGKFCTECGRPRPAGAPRYRCGKCGWEPEDPAHPPKFCPQCGDPFDGGDLKK
jgi:membrane protease subunit (stomatin/prohibitin family)